MSDRQRAFTIVELLVVIVVIGIIAAIVIVSYSGVREKANLATLQSDLKNASTQLEVSKTTSNDESYPADQSSANLRASIGTTFAYTRSTTTSYCLAATNNGVTYHINSDDKTLTPGACTPVVSCIDLPGFILVPGSATYGTSDFCVMAYEAKADTNNDGIGEVSALGSVWEHEIYPINGIIKAVSSPQGSPINISRSEAILVSQDYSRTLTGGNCSGCHLITEAEWMTIAQNVLSNPNNWSGGVVGSGYVYSGHNDASPWDTILPISNVNDPYDGTEDFEGDSGNTNGMIGDTQCRRLQLSNGEYIWDLAGNIWEWTSHSQIGGIPDGTYGGWYTEWTSITDKGNLLIDPQPLSTNIVGSDGWNSINGIGVFYGNDDNNLTLGLIRGGDYESVYTAGILSLLMDSPDQIFSGLQVGFRVAR